MAPRIADLPPESRPRERMLARGPAALADAELVALLLGSGPRGSSALDLAQRLLQRFGGLHGLLHAGEPALRAVSGLGPAKYALVAAVLELARRALVEPMRSRRPLDHPAAVRDFLRLWLGGERVEVFVGLFLDQRHRLIEARQLARGSLAQAAVHPREVVRAALDLDAAALVVAHNHPSGVAEPSPADIGLTRRLRDALALVEMRLLDHLVVTRGEALSFAEAGLL